MIFITVGTQLPFDRLLDYFSEWQERENYKGKVVAQVGEGSVFSSSDIEIYKKLSNDDYYHWFRQAAGIVSHTGMGGILSCLEHSKRGVFLAREYARSEHRNDHQLDTTKAFQGQYPGLMFCTEKTAFQRALSDLARLEDTPVAHDQFEDDALGRKIADYIGLSGVKK